MMGGLISRRKRAKVAVKQASTSPSQLLKESETPVHARTEPRAGDSLNAVLQYIGKRLNARRRRHSQENRKRSSPVQSRTSRQEEKLTGASGSGEQQDKEEEPGFNANTSSDNSFAYTAALGEPTNKGFGDVEVKSNAVRREVPPEKSPRGRPRLRTKPRTSSSSKDRQHTFNFRAPKITPSVEDVPSRACNRRETSQDSISDPGEGSSRDSQNESQPKVVRDSSPSLEGYRDEQLEVKNKGRSSARKEHWVMGEQRWTTRQQWEQSSDLPPLPSRTSTSGRYSRRLPGNVKLRVYHEPRSLEEELELLTVEEILQAGFGSRFQGDVLEVGAMIATGSYITPAGVNLGDSFGQMKGPGLADSVDQTRASNLAVHQIDNVGQRQGCMWPPHRSVDSLVPGYGDMGGKGAAEDIAEDTLDCNVDDRISSPPVCCGCEKEWETPNMLTTLDLREEVDLSAPPEYTDFQQSKSSERNATGTVDTTKALEAVAMRVEGTVKIDNGMSGNKHHASSRSMDTRRQPSPPSLVGREEQILLHSDQNTPGGEDIRPPWIKSEVERKNQEAVAMLVLTGKIPNDESTLCKQGGGDCLAVAKEGENTIESVGGRDSRETTTCKSPCIPQEQPMLSSGNEVQSGRQSSDARDHQVHRSQSTSSDRSTLCTWSDTCLEQPSISGPQRDTSSNRPADSDEWKDFEIMDLPYVLQDQLLLQHIHSTGLAAPEAMSWCHGDCELVTATCTAVGTDLPILSGSLDESIVGMKVSDPVVFKKSHVEHSILSGEQVVGQDHMNNRILPCEQLSGHDVGSTHPALVQANKTTGFHQQTRHIDHSDPSVTRHGCPQPTSCSNESDTFSIQHRCSGIHSLHMMASEDL